MAGDFQDKGAKNPFMFDPTWTETRPQPIVEEPKDKTWYEKEREKALADQAAARAKAASDERAAQEAAARLRDANEQRSQIRQADIRQTRNDQNLAAITPNADIVKVPEIVQSPDPAKEISGYTGPQQAIYTPPTPVTGANVTKPPVTRGPATTVKPPTTGTKTDNGAGDRYVKLPGQQENEDYWNKVNSYQPTVQDMINLLMQQGATRSEATKEVKDSDFVTMLKGAWKNLGPTLGNMADAYARFQTGYSGPTRADTQRAQAFQLKQVQEAQAQQGKIQLMIQQENEAWQKEMAGYNQQLELAKLDPQAAQQIRIAAAAALDAHNYRVNELYAEMNLYLTKLGMSKGSPIEVATGKG